MLTACAKTKPSVECLNVFSLTADGVFIPEKKKRRQIWNIKHRVLVVSTHDLKLKENWSS